MSKGLLSLEEVAGLLGMSRATVNYYTNLALFRVADRKGNKRFYDRGDILSRFDKIKELRKQGYSLMLIQTKLFTEQ